MYTLVPIAELDRSQLRLTYLDFGIAKTSLPSGHPFRADISILKDRPSAHDSKLLLARLAPNGGLYIIERIGDNVFVASRLRSCVREELFRASFDGSFETHLLNEIRHYGDRANALVHHTATTALALASNNPVHSPKRPRNRKGVLARMAILPRTDSGNPSVTQEKQELESKKDDAVLHCTSLENLKWDTSHTLSPVKGALKPDTSKTRTWSTQAGVAEISRPESGLSYSSDELFETLREILLKTLYTSKTALAYFTKSTLARTRATIRSVDILTISELAGFYRTRLLTPRKMDLKYHETIPKIIDSAFLQESPEKLALTSLSAASRKKSGRRKQLGKDSLFAGEERFIRAWWLDRNGEQNDSSRTPSREETIQRVVRELRNRETQLQIILILEILTLESTTVGDREGDIASQAVKQEPDDGEAKSDLAKIPSKPSKKRDLKHELDILVDRLCIYQTVSIIEPSMSGKIRINNGDSGQEIRDRLRDFACNVILPFYFHKVPDLVEEISRKLGGPDISPKRPMKSSRAASRTSSRVKPGMAMETHRRYVPRNTLERVLSEEQSGRQRTPPVLMRSATAPLGIGCNGNSTDATQRPISRGSLQKSRSFSNREVDLVASSKAHEAKRKKLADLAKQKEALDAAIHTLKKPNRSLVGIEIMEEAAKRSAKQDTLGRSNTIYRNPFGQYLDVQITATPKKEGKFYDAHGKQQKQDWETTRDVKAEASKMLEMPSVPASCVREAKSRVGQADCKAAAPSAVPRARHPAVHETPSRRSSKTSNPLAVPPSIDAIDFLKSPTRCFLPTNLSLVEATPSTNRLQPDHANPAEVENTAIRMTKSQRPVLFTPLTKTEVQVESVFRDAPLVSENAAKAMEKAIHGVVGKEASIYDSLGWDDDIDELV